MIVTLSNGRIMPDLERCPLSSPSMNIHREFHPFRREKFLSNPSSLEGGEGRATLSI